MTEVTAKHVSPTSYFEIDNGIFKYRLLGELSEPMNSKELREFYKQQQEEGNPLPLDSIRHIQMFDDAVKSGNPELKNFIRDSLRRNMVSTTSSVIYTPEGNEVSQKDDVIHNHGTLNEYGFRGNLIGERGLISSINNTEGLELLAGTNDVKGLNKISKGINGTPMCLYRPNFKLKPPKEQESAVGFRAIGGGLDLNTGGHPSIRDPVFLVEMVDGDSLHSPPQSGFDTF